jgi:hypothetical protein
MQMDKPTAFEKVSPHNPGRKFADMTATQKVLFLLKLTACIATFGFAFPNVQHD